MMEPGQTEPEVQYLQRLEHALRGIDEPDRSAIVAEIRSHIAERSVQQQADIASILAALGEPEQLGRSYVEDHELSGALQRAAPGPLLATILNRATRSFTAFAVGLVAVTLYAFALSFGILAVMKPIAPASVGLWRSASTFQFGFLASHPASTTEALGYWIVPLSLVAAVLCYLAASALMKRGGRLLLHQSKARPPT